MFKSPATPALIFIVLFELIGKLGINLWSLLFRRFDGGDEEPIELEPLRVWRSSSIKNPTFFDNDEDDPAN